MKSNDSVRKAFAYILNEAFEGPGEKEGMFLNPGPGIVGTLAALNAEQASTSVGGNTIAGHARHLKLYIDVLLKYMEGSIISVNWKEEWKRRDADHYDWSELVKAIRESRTRIEEMMDEIESWDADRIVMVLSVAVHTTYHLGAIRQIAKHLG